MKDAIVAIDAIEASICAARRTPAYGWLGLLALVGPWFAGALLWSALSVG